MKNKNCDPNSIQELEHLTTKLIKELNQLDTEIELENEMDWASEQMEIDEIFENLKYFPFAYREGFSEGFSYGRRLMLKHDIMKAESIHNKYLDLKARFGITD